jgi:hypothetical protein
VIEDHTEHNPGYDGIKREKAERELIKGREA